MPEKNEKSAKYMIRHAAGLYYLVFLDHGEYRQPLRMNDSAYFIFQRYTQGQDSQSIAEDLAKEYEVSASDVQGDVTALITMLKNNGITAGV